MIKNVVLDIGGVPGSIAQLLEDIRSISGVEQPKLVAVE